MSNTSHSETNSRVRPDDQSGGELSNDGRNGGIHPDIIAGVVIVIASALLLTRTSSMPAMSALLPVTMLVLLLVLGTVLMARVFLRRHSALGPVPKYQMFTNLRRFLGVVVSIVAYIAGVALVGFYTTTAIMIPIVAWCFGYRSLKGLLLADVIFVGGIAMIFVFLMGQELPAEFFIR
ncbi:tripartite tricarboxylate transporter TctB family protein [Kushneria aurantia]|uniref:Tripartite tricarboxylate transporter TctB family protein n=1 Tax=Kushneria aurantia TaxID=504092 RepID=A0ABV6FZN7_9GAMM|nr:tripartite tricarboxylate transporter TctB family protein [Kushneria aurantia]